MKYTWQHKKRIIFQHFVFFIQSKHLNKTFMLTNSQIYLMKIIQIPHIINPLMFNLILNGDTTQIEFEVAHYC